MRFHTPERIAVLRYSLSTLAFCCVIFLSPQTAAQSPTGQQAEIPETWQQLLENLESLTRPLGENSKDYIDCMEQQPDLKSNPEDIAALLEEIKGMSQTCQFLLDDLLRQYQEVIERKSAPSDKNSI